MKKIAAGLAAIMATIGLAGAAALPAYAQGVDVWGSCNGQDNAVCRSADNGDAASNIAEDIIRILLWLIGIVAVIVIVIAGFRYVVSSGDSNKVQAAKNTILYAVIGLAVALLGQAIVILVSTNVSS